MIEEGDTGEPPKEKQMRHLKISLHSHSPSYNARELL